MTMRLAALHVNVPDCRSLHIARGCAGRPQEHSNAAPQPQSHVIPGLSLEPDGESLACHIAVTPLITHLRWSIVLDIKRESLGAVGRNMPRLLCTRRKSNNGPRVMVQRNALFFPPPTAEGIFLLSFLALLAPGTATARCTRLTGLMLTNLA
ncbi:hypothetical protein VTN00DRAFT_3961 [Thermoascus crustaceus]|uniref:uncharacterized protein n=1 Tax=Thermoascus crustaceus TaxID=5088 RepID=UPI0037442B9B